MALDGNTGDAKAGHDKAAIGETSKANSSDEKAKKQRVYEGTAYTDKNGETYYTRTTSSERRKRRKMRAARAAKH